VTDNNDARGKPEIDRCWYLSMHVRECVHSAIFV